MKRLLLVLVATSISCAPAAPAATADDEAARWERQAQSVTIIRDSWGIPHVYGKTDADVVFGVVYAQAEDDFNRVETNYLNSMGRLAEAEGESQIYRDLRMKLFIDPADLKAHYEKSPDWLKALMNAYADGLNYYLRTHPDVKPRVITRFEPWMALSFTEGSIGGDIERVNLTQLEAFYGGGPKPVTTTASAADLLLDDLEPRGSNGIAIAPSNTTGGKSLLLINPHTSFFFRAEAQMVSEEGLNAYGAITWGQFFIYQGFNDRAGWMHTSSGVDNIDEYLETIVKKGEQYFYKYGSEERPVTATTIKVPYKSGTGMAEKTFTVYTTHHGPVVREADGKWVSIRLMQEPINALTQSYSRTKARSYKAFRESMELHTNSSNNTIYADADGNDRVFPLELHPEARCEVRLDQAGGRQRSGDRMERRAVDRRDARACTTRPIGWLYNTNNWPWSAAGANSPKKADYPVYVDRNGENPRGIHAIRVLEHTKDFTLDSLMAAAYDSYLPAFAAQIPALVSAWEKTPASSPLKKQTAEQIALLKGWDYRWSASSVPTSVAVYWGEEIGRRVNDAARQAGMPGDEYVVQKAAPELLLQALAAASDKLTADFGTWKTPWGDINRFQRLTGDIVQPFNDSGASIPVAFTSARWGSLASFGARTYPGTKKMYGTSGNSFVAVVEFGDQVRAKAVTAGGQNGDPVEQALQRPGAALRHRRAA